MLMLKKIVYSFLGGVLFAFVSFYLLSATLRNDPFSMIFYGIQGIFFFFIFKFYFAIGFRYFRKVKAKMLFYLLVGTITGMFSSFVYVIVTVYNVFILPTGEVIMSVKHAVVIELLYYVSGSSLLGLIIGFLIYKCSNSNRAKLNLGE